MSPLRCQRSEAILFGGLQDERPGGGRGIPSVVRRSPTRWVRQPTATAAGSQKAVSGAMTAITRAAMMPTIQGSTGAVDHLQRTGPDGAHGSHQQGGPGLDLAEHGKAQVQSTVFTSIAIPVNTATARSVWVAPRCPAREPMVRVIAFVMPPPPEREIVAPGGGRCRAAAPLRWRRPHPRSPAAVEVPQAEPDGMPEHLHRACQCHPCGRAADRVVSAHHGHRPPRESVDRAPPPGGRSRV